MIKTNLICLLKVCCLSTRKITLELESNILANYFYIIFILQKFFSQYYVYAEAFLCINSQKQTLDFGAIR